MRSRLRQVAFVSLGILIVLCSTSAPAFAIVSNAPEIDGGSLTAGLGLLTAGVLMLRARRRSR